MLWNVDNFFYKMHDINNLSLENLPHENIVPGKNLTVY